MRNSLSRMLLLLPLCATLHLALPASVRGAEPESAEDSAVAYGDLVRADSPVAYWRFEGKSEEERLTGWSAVDMPLRAVPVGRLNLTAAGPRGPQYPAFSTENTALSIPAGQGYLKVADPGDRSPLDFHQEETLTLEAWVWLDSIRQEQQVYIVGKGRTGNPGIPADNQNYALRLRGDGGTARLSFLYRDIDNRDREDFHRWNSDLGIIPGDGWHHVAVSYTFGDPQSIRGYLDGRPVTGKWDFGGASTQAPIVDNDELWIGSAMGGSASSTFPGRLDEVAVYRHALSPERVAERFRMRPLPPVASRPIPADAVLFEVIEGITENEPWTTATRAPSTVFTAPWLAMVELPEAYNEQALRIDRTIPFLARGSVAVELPAGEYEFLLRSRNAARLLIDGRPVASLPPMKRNASGHEEVPDLSEAIREGLQPLGAGLQERLTPVVLGEGRHVLVVEGVVGGKGLRPEIGELSLAIAPLGGAFTVVTPGASPGPPLDPENWRALGYQWRALLRDLGRELRAQADEAEREYWDMRHATARAHLAEQGRAAPPAPIEGYSVGNEIDRFLAPKLHAAGRAPLPLVDDHTFLRRVSLDTVGVIPTPEEIAAFLADPPAERRARVIDRLLADPRTADHWTAYWQDVLAENPGILKPTLNNTGPFRWWIYESLLDNKPLDRFASELVMMQGSTYGGGPAGFSLATENDVPMAAKAHVLSQAFLAIDLKCARCHDAPNHPYSQEELFSFAAMLERKPIKVPATSSVPRREGSRQPLVEVTLKPGVSVPPAWLLADLSEPAIPDGWLRYSGDTRERLAALLTAPENSRFPRVLANRYWHRLLGQGLVDPVDDWCFVSPSHPELLRWLGEELVASGYDARHLLRLILNSHAYQRQVDAAVTGYLRAEQRLFAGPVRRRMTAEQLVDSLYVAADKQYDSEVLSMDPEGRRPADTFLNLGSPRRAWEFTSLSNERDRPALALPVAQSVTDVLLAYGWRDSRPSPLTSREEIPTPLQAPTLANGLLGRRIARLSDDHRLMESALTAETPEAFVEQLFLSTLSRPPRAEERERYVALLAEGFGERVREAAIVKRTEVNRNAVSWSNHLSAEATRIKLELERQVRLGDPPTERLAAEWRERGEDALWALVASPEFLFVP